MRARSRLEHVVSWQSMFGGHAVLWRLQFVDININDFMSSWARNLTTHTRSRLEINYVDKHMVEPHTYT